MTTATCWRASLRGSSPRDTPSSVMAPIVLVLAVFGAYSVQTSINDVYIMFALGVGMFFLERYGFSAGPLVLGLILGPIAEGNFVEGAMIANAQKAMASALAASRTAVLSAKLSAPRRENASE